MNDAGDATLSGANCLRNPASRAGGIWVALEAPAAKSDRLMGMRLSMQRRQFFQSSAAAALAAAAPIPGQAATARPSKLKLGTQHGDSDEILRVMAAFGV